MGTKLAESTNQFDHHYIPKCKTHDEIIKEAKEQLKYFEYVNKPGMLLNEDTKVGTIGSTKKLAVLATKQNAVQRVAHSLQLTKALKNYISIPKIQ